LKKHNQIKKATTGFQGTNSEAKKSRISSNTDEGGFETQLDKKETYQKRKKYKRALTWEG